MHFVSLDVDGADGTRWAEVLASTATDALLFVDDGNEQDFISWDFLTVGIAPAPTVLMHASMQGYHLYGFGRTFAGTESARFLVLDGNTEVTRPHSVSYLYCCPLFNGDGMYCRGRADLGTTCAFRSAIAFLEAYLGLHEAVEAAAGTQHVVGACVDAQLAGRAMTAEVAYRKRTRRCDEFLATRFLLLDDVSQAAIGRLRFDLCLSLSDGCASKQSYSRQYCTSPFICFL